MATLHSKKRAVELLHRNRCGEVVGYRKITESTPKSWNREQDNPYRSAHFHANIVGYQYVGTTGMIETDDEDYVVRVSTIHDWEN